jgi:hypothetical protein
MLQLHFLERSCRRKSKIKGGRENRRWGKRRNRSWREKSRRRRIERKRGQKFEQPSGHTPIVIVSSFKAWPTLITV